MLETMPWEQFQGWLAYATLEPFGEDRSDLRVGYAAARIAGIIAASQGAKNAKFKPIDFMPQFDHAIQAKAPPKPMTKEEFRVVFDGFKEVVRATAGPRVETG
jgi:hypothetical protein